MQVTQLILNPSQQRASNVAGLGYVSDLLSRCTLYEDGYRRRYEKGKIEHDKSNQLSADIYKTALKELYIRILRFQAQSISQFSRNLISGTAHAVLKLDDWDALLGEIKEHEAKCECLFDGLKTQDALDAREERHKQHMSLLLEMFDGFQAGLKGVRDAIKEVHLNEEERKCFETLRTSDYQQAKDRNPERLPGTCKWFLEHPKYQGWTAQPPVSRLLWVSADPGCGKSVLAKTIVDQYEASSVCYYFFKDDSIVGRSATHALCALLHQLCAVRPALIEHVLPAFRANGSKLVTLFEDLWSAFSAVVNDAATGNMICILDALDECSDVPKEAGLNPLIDQGPPKAEERKRLLQKLVAIASASTSIKILVTSRPYTSIGDALFYRTGLDKSHIHITGEDDAEKKIIQGEIDLVINSRVQEFQKLRESKGICDHVYEKLQRHLEGMENRTYLWVSAVFAKLEADADAPEWELMETIQALPKDVEKAYENILRQSPKRHILEKVLHIMLAAVWPLSLEEMNIALSIQGAPSNTKFSVTFSKDSFRKWIRDLCGFFINVIDDRLLFVHQTAKEYLLGEEVCHPTTMWKGSFKPTYSHTLLARICINCLLIPFEDPLCAKFRNYATFCWPTHNQNAEIDQELLGLAKTFIFQGPAVAPSFTKWISKIPQVYSLDFPEELSRFSRTILPLAHSSPPTPLFLACAYGWLWILDELHATQGINWNRRNMYGATGLQIAARYGHLGIVEKLLEVGADISATARGWGGRTALQAAAEGGHMEIVERLLAAGADINAAAAVGGITALKGAAERGHIEIVERLLVAGADINATRDGSTALEAAARNDHMEIVEKLLVAGADVNAATPQRGRTALQAAAEGGHMEIVERLLAAGADINAAGGGWDGKTALQAAAVRGRMEIVERLLEAGADVNAVPSPEHGVTALQAAAMHPIEIVERLLEAGADVNAVPAPIMGVTALQAAARWGFSVEIVERLLAAGADVDAAPALEYGRTALQEAAEKGRMEIVERLLEAGADVNTVPAPKHGVTALQAAAKNGHMEIVERLLAAGADINAAAGDWGGRTALQAAAEEGRMEIVERLLEAGADVNAAAAVEDGVTALQAAAEKGNIKIVERLQAAGADVDATTTNHGGVCWTALQLAAEKGHIEIVERLLAVGADVNTAGGPLLPAAWSGDIKTVERLLVAGADINAAAGDGRTALQAAAEGGHMEIVERLLEAGADVNAAAAVAEDGRTALQAAAGEGHMEIVERLLAAGADVNAAAAAAAEDGRTALQAAAEEGHMEIVERLLAAGADVDAITTNRIGDCWTALQIAAREDCIEIVERLLAAGADVNAAGGALRVAAWSGHKAVIKLLLATDGVDPDLEDSNGLTPLSLAAQGGHEAVVKLLLATGGVEPNSKDSKYGWTPLSWAAGYGHKAVVKVLLATRGVEPDSKDNNGRTPLSLAAGRGHEAVIKLLLATDGVDLDSKDSNGRTPLSQAAEGGHEAVVKLLLATDGVDPDSRDSNGRTPLSWAAEEGHEAVVNLLLAAKGVKPGSEDSYG